MSDQKHQFPLLPVKNTVVFPTTSVFLVVGKQKSIASIKHAQNHGGKIVVASLKIPNKEIVESQDEIDLNESIKDDIDTIYPLATLCQIRNISGSDKMGYQVLVTGVSRFKVEKISLVENFLQAEGVNYPDILVDTVNSQALFNNVKKLAQEVLSLLPASDGSLHTLLDQIQNQDELIYLVASYLKLNLSQMQEILIEDDIEKKMKLLLDWLKREKDVLMLEKNIRDKVGKKLTQAQRETLLREQLKAIKDELGETEDANYQNFSKKIEAANMPLEVRKIANEELKRLEGLHSSSADFYVIRNYLEWLCQMPWNKSTSINIDLDKSRNILEQNHYGLKKIKKRILEHLAVMKLKKNLKGPILCLVGPPGVGKTSLGKSIADALGTVFVRASLGGIRDESEIRGHRRTYVGAIPGRIIQSIKRAGVKNPLILLDEIDKLGFGIHGDPASALLEVLDPEQNNTFVDHYLDLPFDLSHVFFVATANLVESIPGPLRDRMEIIFLNSYTKNEKFHIGNQYIIPQAIDDNGLKSGDIIFHEDVLSFIIDHYTHEAGVRELKRVISSLCRGAAYDIVNGALKPFELNLKTVYEYLGPKKFLETQKLRKWIPGMATALAWTPAGGDILYLECVKYPGSGKLKITGQLGDVMKESAELALSFVKSNIEAINPDFQFEDNDIHLHIPAGAIPKDGPSAGITMLTALASLIADKETDQSLAMTGELTLSGSVLPIGGLKEKIIAAYRYNLKKIIFPKQNEKDLNEIPDEIQKDFEFFPINCAEEVLKIALEIVLNKHDLSAYNLEKINHEINHDLQ